MGSYILRGITTALLVTVLTLFAGIIWSTMGFGGLSVSQLIDIGLLASCLVGGFRAAKESGVWLLGGVAGAGYVVVGTLLLALFLPIRSWGFVQVLGEGTLIGLVAGAFGAGTKQKGGSTWNPRKKQMYTPSYVGYGTDDSECNDFDWDTGMESEQNLTFSENSTEQFVEEETEKIEWPWDREAKNKTTGAIAPDSDSKVAETEHEQKNSNRFWDKWREEKVNSGKANSRGSISEKLTPNSSADTRPWWEQ